MRRYFSLLVFMLAYACGEISVHGAGPRDLRAEVQGPAAEEPLVSPRIDDDDDEDPPPVVDPNPPLPAGVRIFEGEIDEEVTIGAGEHALLVGAPVFKQRVQVKEGASINGSATFEDELDVAGTAARPVAWKLDDTQKMRVARPHWEWMTVHGGDLAIEPGDGRVSAVRNVRFVRTSVVLTAGPGSFVEIGWNSFDGRPLQVTYSDAVADVPPQNRSQRVRIIGNEFNSSFLSFKPALSAFWMQGIEANNFLTLAYGTVHLDGVIPVDTAGQDFNLSDLWSSVPSILNKNYFTNKRQTLPFTDEAFRDFTRHASWIKAPFRAGPGALDQIEGMSVTGVPVSVSETGWSDQGRHISWYVISDQPMRNTVDRPPPIDMSRYVFSAIARATLEDELISYSSREAPSARPDGLALILAISPPSGCTPDASSAYWNWYVCPGTYTLTYRIDAQRKGKTLQTFEVDVAYDSLSGAQVERRTRLAMLSLISQVADAGMIVELPSFTPYF